MPSREKSSALSMGFATGLLESVDIAEAIRLKGGEKPQRPQRDAESLLLFELVDHSLDSIL